jgi:hypothetical protein
MSEIAKRQFVRQQGFGDAPAASCAYLYPALMLQPRLLAAVVLLAIVLQSAAMFLILAGILWWNVLVPRRNPFDALYNQVIAAPRNLPPLTPAPAPRRFAQGMAGTLLAGAGLVFLAERPGLAWTVEGVVAVALGALVLGRFCLDRISIICCEARPASPTVPSRGVARSDVLRSHRACSSEGSLMKQAEPRAVLLAAVTFLAACQQAPTLAGERRRLEALLAADRQAHLRTDPQLLAAHLADTLLSIDGGQVTAQPRDAVRRMFAEYFAGATYHAWEDVVPPTIRIAADGSQAWVVRQVCVDRQGAAGGGERRRQRFVSAYTATYGKRDTAWVMTSVTSTVAAAAPERCLVQEAA